MFAVREQKNDWNSKRQDIDNDLSDEYNLLIKNRELTT